MFYVNCSDKYGFYNIMATGSSEEARKTEALLNAMHSPVRKFSSSSFAAPPLTQEMLQNPQDIRQERYVIQRYDKASGTHIDEDVRFDEEEARNTLRTFRGSQPTKRYRIAQVVDTFLHGERIKREYKDIML